MILDADVEARLPSTLNEWQGIHATIFADDTREIDVEGARESAKTTLLLDRRISLLKRFPGIHTLICRYSDTATKTKLKPRFESLCAIRGFTSYNWNDKELAYEFSNGSKVYAFGLKAANQTARYEKIRGLDVSDVYVDQAEELPADIGQELRASLRQRGYPHQLTFSPNPVSTTHWLADERHGGFPEDNSVPGRRYYRLSIDDNAYNLSDEDIASMKATFPPDHAKHGAMILGRRGFNVIGDPIFEDTFMRKYHVRELRFDPESLLLEGFDFGKKNPAYVAAQRLPDGGLVFLAGIIGENLFLQDFVPFVVTQREKWFPNLRSDMIRTCCPAQGPLDGGNRFTSLAVLRKAGFQPISRDGSNAADVSLAMIEQLAGYMRRRNASGKESFGINNDESHWLKASRQGVPEPWPFMAQAFEAGAVWDKHFRSVGNNVVRQMATDDWFANAVRCAQNIELNFCANQLSQDEIERRRASQRSQDSDGSSRYGSTWGWS